MDSRLLIRLRLFAGIGGPVFFFTAVAIVGSLRPDYSHVNQFISELGEAGGHFAWAMNYLGFMMSAALIFVFVLVLRERLPRTALNLLGTALFRTASWRRFGIYSLVTAVSSLVLLVAMVESESSREGTGMYQRLYLGVLFLWFMAISVRQLIEFKDSDSSQ